MNPAVCTRADDAAHLDQLINLLAQAKDNEAELARTGGPTDAGNTISRFLVRRGRAYQTALGFSPTESDAQQLARDLDAHSPAVDPNGGSLYSAAALEASGLLDGVPGSERGPFFAGLILTMLMASREIRLGALLAFARHLYPPGSAVAFTTMLPVEANKALRGYTWHPEQEDADVQLRAFLADAEDQARNIYLCTNPVDAAFRGEKPGDKAVTFRIHGLLDIDRKSVAKGMDEAEARGRVDAATDAAIARVGAPPCARAWSGNGEHTWFNVPADIDRQVWADVCAATGSDAVNEPSRIARAPWTFNVPAPTKRDRDGYRPRLAYLVEPANPSALVVDPQHLAREFPSRKSRPKHPKASVRTATARHGTEGLAADEAKRLELLWPLIEKAATLADLPNEIRKQAEAALVGDQFLRDRYNGHAGPLVDRFGTPRLPGFMERDRSSATMSLIGLSRRAGLSLEVTAALAVTHETGELLPGVKHDEAGRKRAFGRCWSKATAPEDTDTVAAFRGGTALRRAEDAILAMPSVELWRSRTGRFIALPTGRGVEHFDLQSAEARDAIFATLRQLPDRSLHLPPKGVADLAETLYAVAHAAPELPMGVRSASQAGAGGDYTYVNLANAPGEVIEVTPAGYQIVPSGTAPVRFPRRSNLRPLAAPAAGMKASDFLPKFRKHIALPPRVSESATDAGVQADAAVLLFLTSALRRDGEVAHLLLTGPAGAGKTTTALRMKDLCDPTNPPLSAAPRDVLGLVALAKGQGITALDNTSSVSPDMADMLCGFATGSALTARQLYSNGDLYSVEVLAPVIFTTVVPDLRSRPDLLSRIARVVLERRATTTPKALLDAAWQADRPALFGALLDVLAGALAGWRGVAQDWSGKALDRLAGPLVFAEAAARAMLWRPNLLIEAMRESWREQQTDAASGDPVLAALLELVRRMGNAPWEGSTADLLSALTSPFGSQGKLGIRSPQGLGQAIARLDPGALADLGLVVTQRRVNGRKVLTVTKAYAAGADTDRRADPDFPF